MENRYLVATGNWNDTAVWSATSGGAGGASVPTASDNVYINAKFTVTLTANAYCSKVFHTNGTINLSSYLLWCRYRFDSTGSTARTVNLQSGTLELPQHSSVGDNLNLSGSNLSWNAGTSLVKFGTIYSTPNREFNTLSKTFNDVQINLGGSSYSTTLSITGSPTFRSLIIQSKNSAAHTVNFDGSANNVKVSKLILLGSNSSNKLNVSVSGSSFTELEIALNGTCYGQYVNIVEDGIKAVIAYYDGVTGWDKAYIGSNSVDATGTWAVANPPKISTLIDPLTTAYGSNTNWTFTGTVTDVTIGNQGGGYQLASGATMTSSNTYDLVDSYLIFERTPTQTLGTFGIVGLGEVESGSKNVVAWSRLLFFMSTLSDVAKYSQYDNVGGYNDFFTYPISVSKYIRIKIVSGDLIMESSTDGITWANAQTVTLSDLDLLMFRSTRIKGDGGGQQIGSIGMLPTPSVTKLLKQNGRFIKANGKYLKV